MTRYPRVFALLTGIMLISACSDSSARPGAPPKLPVAPNPSAVKFWDPHPLFPDLVRAGLRQGGHI